MCLRADGRRPALDIHVDHAGTGTDVLAMRITLSPNGTPQVTRAPPLLGLRHHRPARCAHNHAAAVGAGQTDGHIIA